MATFALPHNEAVVLEMVRRRGGLLTRIKEAGDGDREFLQPGVPGVEASGHHEAFGITEDDVLTCLHALEDRGLVKCTLSPHAWSATEYVCEWTLCERKCSQRQRDARRNGDSVSHRGRRAG